MSVPTKYALVFNWYGISRYCMQIATFERKKFHLIVISRSALNMHDMVSSRLSTLFLLRPPSEYTTKTADLFIRHLNMMKFTLFLQLFILTVV